jgi:hypothetical protein
MKTTASEAEWAIMTAIMTTTSTAPPEAFKVELSGVA